MIYRKINRIAFAHNQIIQVLSAKTWIDIEYQLDSLKLIMHNKI